MVESRVSDSGFDHLFFYCLKVPTGLSLGYFTV